MGKHKELFMKNATVKHAHSPICEKGGDHLCLAQKQRTYAMPEKGTKVVLNVAGRNEQDAFVLHCIPNNVRIDVRRIRVVSPID